MIELTEGDQCTSCFYNRPMKAWGEVFDACWYTHDNKGKQLYGGNGCSGYDSKEKQLEIEIEVSA